MKAWIYRLLTQTIVSVNITSLIFTSFMVSTSSLACVEGNEYEGILPPNDLYISTFDHTFRSNINHDQFIKIIDDISDIYRPIMKERDGLDLVMNKLWGDGTVNASAQQRGSRAIVNMFGGLARHPAITADGFALVVCHEIGHHIGGQPKIVRFFNTMWASNEGQSDYFASAKCMKKYYEKHPVDITTINVNPYAVIKCREVFRDDYEIEMCERGSAAGESLASLFSSLRKVSTPQLDTPTPKVARRMNHAHPEAQCRLDTYFAGTLCTIGHDEDLSDENTIDGACTRRDGFQVGVRPICWFRTDKAKG